MQPLIKTTGISSGVRFWSYQINGHYFGLSFNPKATVTHFENATGFVIRMNDSVKIELAGAETFRMAVEYVINLTVAKYYGSQPKDYSQEERAELLTWK